MTPEMKKPTRRDERGMVVLLMAIALVGLIGAGSLVVDIGMGLVTKAELQNVSDASALAGTRKLAELYSQHRDWIAATDNCSNVQSQVENEAQDYAEANKAGGTSISVPNSDIVLGNYDKATGEVTETCDKIRVVQVRAAREAGNNGVVPTRLARVLGINDIAVDAQTAAALTPIQTLHGNQGDFPIGISKQWFDSHNCGSTDTTIVLFPTSPTSCAGWHVFTEKVASASKLGTVVDGLKTGAFQSPETVAGQTYYNFIGGTVESKCSNLKELFDAKKVGGRMKAHIPVYDFDCGNVSGERLILGFVDAEITKVICGSSVRRLELEVKCGIVGDEVGEGGGAYDYGLLSDSPSMVSN